MYMRCSLYSIVFTRLIKRPGDLNKFDINFIVRQGDLVYKSLKTDEQIIFCDLPKNISVLESPFKISSLDNKYGFLNPGQSMSFLFQNKHTSFNPGDGILFLIKGYCMSFIPRKNAIFLFDSYSRNILGQPIPDGFSIFIKFKTKNDAEKYILETYVTAQDINIQYEIQSISVEQLDDSNLSNRYRLITDKERKKDPESKKKASERNKTESYRNKSCERKKKGRQS